MAGPILDKDWVRQANLLPRRIKDGPVGLSKQSTTIEQILLRRYTSASFKFTNGTLGGNFALNMPPQPCRFADPVPPRFITPKVPGGKAEWGMSRWYSENIDDLSTLLHIRLGVPAYNSLWSFFSNFYSPDDARLVRTGRDFSLGSFIGRALGWVFSIRLLPFIWTGQTIKFFTTVTSTKFAYLKPEMGLYWKYVSDIANTLGANLDITANADASYLQLAENFQRRAGDTKEMTATPTNSATQATKDAQEPVYQQTPEMVEKLQRWKNMGMTEEGASKAAASLFTMSDGERNYYKERLPEIYQSDGLVGINIYAVVLRAQSMADAWNQKVLEEQAKAAETPGGNIGLVETLRNWITGGGATVDLQNHLHQRTKTVEDYLGNKYFKSTYGGLDKNKAAAGSDANFVSAENNPTVRDIQDQAKQQANKDKESSDDGGSKDKAAEVNGNGDESMIDTLKRYSAYAYENIQELWSNTEENVSSLKRVFKAAQHDGSQFLTLRVNGRESVSESFSNSTRQSDIANMMNSASASARNFMVNIADGNVTGIPILQQIAGFIGQVAAGAADSLRIAGVGALMGNAFVDIPEHYDASQASFNQMSYTIHLRAPYGNDHSRFQNELLTLSCLLATVLPRSAGAASYGIPFHCEAYCRGRGQTRFGIVSQLDITRATANMPWTEDGRYRGIDVRITIKDLSTVMHMAQNEVLGWRAMDPTRWGSLIFPQDSSFSDYMAVLSSLGLADQIYKLNKLKRNWRALEGSFEKWWSPQARAVSLFSGLTGQVLSAFSHTVRR